MPIDEQKINRINIRSEYFQDILDKVPSRIITYGSIGMLVIFIIIIIGMKVVRYPDVITSEAVVTTSTPPVTVHNRVSSRIVSLLKADQDTVSIGEWIMVLYNSASYQEVLQLREILRHVSGSGFWEKIDTVKFEELTALGDMQSGYARFYKSVEELRLFNRLNIQRRQLTINADRARSMNDLDRQLQHKLTILQRQSMLSKSDLDRNMLLDSLRVVAKTEVEQKEIAYLNTQSIVEELNNTRVSNQLQEQALTKENVTLAADYDNTLFNLRKNIFQSYSDLTFQLTEWQNKYVLDAPVSGVLNFYDIRTADQFLSNEQKVFTITPVSGQEYFAIAKLPITNSGKVRVGLKCNIRLNNYPYTEFGMLKGTVTAMSAAAKEGFYSVKVQLPKPLVTTLHKPLDNKSELTGEADIIVEDLTLYDRLFNSIINKNTY
ncbi:HlyD family secretion protein [Chitinophaga sp. CF118]|uniref:HlyD family efflux transporter periplasmic adaptor subunit n=1 Tax=Chitinophaga sp. CF118 TaxID=1884367 RepID=UPI0008E0E2FB|nr:HlyD family efflux transporter periplasmic adaptor subunit [Chitinophaga sp. CF118]SFE50188.1 HlyD family secretion protein [Chitinophaga sp. CF118]